MLFCGNVCGTRFLSSEVAHIHAHARSVHARIAHARIDAQYHHARTDRKIAKAMLINMLYCYSEDASW